MKFNQLKIAALIILSAFLCPSAFCQELRWPVSGKSAGENIAAQPQNYIGDEFNFGNLFIACSEGDVIVSPADGEVTVFIPSYQLRLTSGMSFGLDGKSSFDEWIKDANISGIDPTYVNMLVFIKTNMGYTVQIDGIKGDRSFRTGQKIAAGDILGVAGYSYKGIRGPSISVAVTKGGKMSDPMTPFGLKTTFKEAKEERRPDPIPVDKAREDLKILMESVLDEYPSLDEVMTDENYRMAMDSLMNTVTKPMRITTEFRHKLMNALGLVHDSHIGLLPDRMASGNGGWMTPALYYRWDGDSIRVITTFEQYKNLIGKAVVSINGISAAEHVAMAKRFSYIYDAKVESTAEEEMVLLYLTEEMMHDYNNPDEKQHVVFSDGTSADIPFVKTNMSRNLIRDERAVRSTMWYSINRMRSADDVFRTEILNDSTALLSIRNFDLNQVQEDRIASFLDTLKTSNLIIDLRNNPGGESEVVSRMLSYFATEPFDRQKGGYNMVLKKGGYDSFKHSLNYSPDMEPFAEYEKVEGLNGFISRGGERVEPDSLIHYDGRVYVLTNGHSYSAATLLPSVLVRNRRAVTVGRETGTAYHYMTALKFADIVLPNSRQTIRIPLVKSVFDTTYTERTPKGRGLLPDYPVPISELEVSMGKNGNTDVMLEYALSLIADGKYLSESDPFASADFKENDSSRARTMMIALIGLCFVALMAGLWAVLRKKRRS